MTMEREADEIREKKHATLFTVSCVSRQSGHKNLPDNFSPLFASISCYVCDAADVDRSARNASLVQDPFHRNRNARSHWFRCNLARNVVLLGEVRLF